MIEFLTKHLVELVALALITWMGDRMRRALKRWDELSPERPAEGPSGPEPEPAVDVPVDRPIGDRVRLLAEERAAADRAAREARSRDQDPTEHEERHRRLATCLRDLAFLTKGDELEERYVLLEQLGSGRLGVVWKAYDRERDCHVAVKLLKHTFLRDESVVRRFRYTSRVMAGINASNVAAVYRTAEDPAAEPSGLCYYVMEYVGGRRLDRIATEGHEHKDRIVDGLLDLTRGIASTHGEGIVHRDIKPANILVGDDGSVKLVDFDAVLQLGDRRVSDHEVGTFGYSAPEVLEGSSDPDVTADIFALGRVFSRVYYGEDFPDAYAMSVDETIELLNCAPEVKQVMEKATEVDRRRRYRALSDFLGAMKGAVRSDRAKLFRFQRSFGRDQRKISATLRHTAVLTVLAIVPARAIGASLQAVHLSNTVPVAIFHGVIGALVWGTFIPLAYILYLVSVSKWPRLTEPPGFTGAMLVAGLGGLLGGALVAVPSVFVTHADTLRCLGWLTDGTGARLEAALLETKMMWSYPITGMLTGCGLGLCLHLGVTRALELKPLGTGIIPPSWKRSEDLGLLVSVLRSPKAHLFLLFPVLLSPLLWLLVLDPAAAQGLDCGAVTPAPVRRSLGEGLVHYAGAIGVTWGFLRHVDARPEARGP